MWQALYSVQSSVNYCLIIRYFRAYSIVLRYKSLENKTKGPGPGNYEFEAKNKEKAPSYGFGSSTRKEITSSY